MGQRMQFRWFCGSGAVPGRHSWQLDSASPPSLPSHGVQDPPDRNVPFRQWLQLDSPGPEKRPFGHVLHVLAWSVANLPAVQETHSVWMELGTVPMGQGPWPQLAAPTAATA